MIFFTADEHYYHRNVIRYCNRPFKDVNEMNNSFIKLHNEVVSPSDTIFHVGDFSMVGKSQHEMITAILKKLNGTHHLILGNHDEIKPFTYVNAGFTSVHTSYEIELPNHNDYLKLRSLGYEKLILNHDPSMYCICKNAVLVCGHVHTLFKIMKDKKVINVGVDMWDYKPISLTTLIRQFNM
jgi:calcineurin-like phosphoesterase family protein